MATLGPFENAPELAVAVSGGVDSMALLLLADAWGRARGGRVVALTVDHGLRAGSADEARRVGAWCAARGIGHRVLEWCGDKPTAGIQAAARAARYALLSGWCRENAVPHLLLAHQAGDQAETFLYRMGRGSGVDGLAGMPAVAVRDGVRLLRPLLDVPRARLAALLAAERQDHVDDPSNRDGRYARIAIRRRLPALEAAGVGPAAFRRATRSLGGLRAVRDRDRAALAAVAVALYPEGYAEIAADALRAADPETARDVLSAVLKAVGGGAYGPRRVRLDRLADAVLCDEAPRARTLGGCAVVPGAAAIRVWREPRAVTETAAPVPGAVLRWDGRFDLRIAAAVQFGGDYRIARLGETGWQAIADSVEAAAAGPIPGPVRFSLPALHDGNEIAEVPHLRYRRGRNGRRVLEAAVFRPVSALAPAPFRVA